MLSLRRSCSTRRFSVEEAEKRSSLAGRWKAPFPWRRWTNLDVRDYDSLLRLSNNYSVSELRVENGDWLANRSLNDLGLNQEGVTVLGIQRAGESFIAVPTGADIIKARDTLVLYGHIDSISRLDQRPAGPQGDAEHYRAVAGGT